MRGMKTLKRSLCSCSLRVGLLAGCVAAGALSLGVAHAQVTNAAGTIQGTVTDPTGAVIANAQVIITEPSTGFAKTVSTNAAGYYSAGSLVPGNYVVHITAAGFAPVDLNETVEVGVASNGNAKLTLGSSATRVVVEANALHVDTTQTTVEGVLDRQQIQTLPLNGRNFLDLAQLQPGVQIQDGTNFDPTKNGFSSISFGGRYGRTARISLDGLDISDENVGTTTQNISEDAIEEFQVAQSNLDITTSITSSGSVNIVSRSGTNHLHGDAFYNFRDKRAGGANFPGGEDNYLQRNDTGAAFGGPIMKDKAFYFLSVENFLQHLDAPVSLASTPLADVSGSFGSPFKELELFGRVDFNLPRGVHLFLRSNYDDNDDVAGFGGGNNYSPYKNQNITPDYAGGLDFVTGQFSHSLRIGYFKFVNHIVDATAGSGIYDPAPEINIAIGSFSSGPNLLAPQTTIQSNKEFRYDGSWVAGNHTVRYGVAYSRLYGGGYASFFGIAPQVQSSYDAATLAYMQSGNYTMPFAGGIGNPLNYPVGYSNGGQSLGAILGNGQGYDTEIANFGFPGGGQFDSRLALYLGDTWKITPRLVVNYGLRYIHDTGREDSDLPAIPLLDQLGPGLGDRIHQPGANFGPQAGIDYDLTGKGTTVLRAGAGVYYENNVWNNVLFDRPARLQTGLFFGDTSICPSGSITLPGGTQVSSVDGLDIATQICGQPIGQVAKAIADLQTEYQQATVNAGPAANGAYIGNTLTESPDGTGDNLFFPGYKTPVSYQINAGIQQALGRNAVLTVNYLRNVNVHTLEGIDANHVGAARYLDTALAQAAINKTLQSCGAATVDDAIASCPADPSGHLTIQTLAENGLDSEYTEAYGFPGSGYAFAGENENFGAVYFLYPVGRSVYNALQANLQYRAQHPLPGVENTNLTVSYALSRFVSTATNGDQDFAATAADFDDPTKYIGPNSLDRTNQFSVGGDIVVLHGLQISTIAHLYSSLPVTLKLPTNGVADIFLDDVTGDGTVGDILPGTNVGAFMRSVKPESINKVIDYYNNNYAGKLTPAGQAVVSAGLLTAQQMTELGGTLETISRAPIGQVGNDMLRIWDISLAYPIKLLQKRFTVEPSMHVFNVLNAANFDAPGNTLTGTLNGASGSVNGSTSQEQYRVGLGTGVYAFGAPRQIEFGLKMSF